MSTVGSAQSQDWTMWQNLDCNEDFLEHPPLLQVNEKFTENSKFVNCLICNLVCPPPPYSCENEHLLCFSCTSVQKGSACPVKINYPTDNACSKENNSRCGKVLRPAQIANYDEQFPEPLKMYSCPFTKFGCGTVNLNPEKVVEHAQKLCQFRYGVKCFIDSCKNGGNLIRFGNLKNHLKEHHGTNELDLEKYQKGDVSIPVKYYYLDFQCVEDFAVPVIFVNGSVNYNNMFAFIVKKTKEFLYFWLYEFVERDVTRKKKLQGRITIVSRELNKWDTPNSEDLACNDIIHDPSVSNDDVIQTGRVIKVPITDFEKSYIGEWQPKAEPNTESGTQPSPYHFYVIKIAILKKKNADNPSTSLSEYDYKRLGSLSLSK